MVSSRFNRLRRDLLLATLVAGGSMLISPGFALAQSSAEANKTVTYSIPAQPLEQALRRYSEASGVQLVYLSKITSGKQSVAVEGPMTMRAALARLLSGSGISFEFSANGAVNLMAGPDSGAHSLGVVRVEGAQGRYGGAVTPVNGVNGSSDIEATEGTGSYTSGALSIVSKTPQSIKETPQAVSVITAQRLADQNLTDFNAAMQAAPGIAVVAGGGDNLSNAYYSRGFQVNTFQIDGGAPLALAGNQVGQITPLMDMAEFDSLQLVRGADGLFSGYGDPSGVINLVRKKPLDHDQLLVEAQGGSFDFYRGMVDLTGPLAFDGRLRGRVVVSGQSEHYFYKLANDQKYSVFGILEYDLTPDTLVTVGADISTLRGLPFADGLPRYGDGTALPLSRETCLCFPWNHVNYQSNEYFASVRQRINKDWSAKINLTYDQQHGKVLEGDVENAVIPGTTSGSQLYALDKRTPTKELVLDTNLTGAFYILGRKQEVVVGGDYQYIDGKGFKEFTNSYSSYPSTNVSLFPFNPSAYPAPTIGSAYLDEVKGGQTQFGFYAHLKAEVLENLHILSGVRYTQYRDSASAAYNFFGYSFTGDDEHSKGSNFSNPNVSVVYDVTKSLSAFIGYTSIYQPQFVSQSNLVPGQKTPPPETGDDFEGGLKWERSDKKLNANLSVFSIKKDGFYTSNGANYSYQLSPSSVDNIKSQGFDLEVTGEAAPGWQVSASYGYNHNKQTENIAYTNYTLNADGPAASYQPRNLVKVWSVYKFQTGTWLKRFEVGGGADYLSQSYNAGYSCTQYVPSIDYSTGLPTLSCASSIPFNFKIKPYTLVSARLAYTLTDNLKLALNITNLTDVNTFVASSAAGTGGGNWYAPPTAFKLTLSGKW